MIQRKAPISNINGQPIIINEEPSLTNPVSQMATEAQCRSDACVYWCKEIRLPHEPIFHRKLWEYAYILQCLSETGMMSPGRRGLGFGVGQEPLFVKNSLKCLRPGEIAVHTTEFNVFSNEATIDHQQTVLFRRQDIDRLAAELTSQGHEIVLNYNTRSGPFDRHIDVPPWSGIHLKLQLEQYITTSLGLLIQKAS